MSERLVFFVKKEILEFAMEKSRELMAAPTCSAEARAAARRSFPVETVNE